MEPRRRKNRKPPMQVNSPFDAKKGRGLKFALIGAGALLLCAALVLLAAWLGWLNIPGITPEAPTEPVQTVQDTVVHFVAGGDLNITDKTVAAGKTDSGYDYSQVFLDVMPVLAGGDLTALNFEGTLCGEPYGSQYASAPQPMLTALRNAGVDILQTANSRTITGGLLGLQSTLTAIRAEGLEPLGSYANKEEFKKYGGFVIRQIEDVRIAVVAFTKGMDGRGLPTGSENCVNLLYEDYASTYQTVNEAGITSVLRAAAAQKPDIVIAMLHWGSEYNEQISKSQEKIVELMRAEGVDAIIGTHSHYVQQMTLDEDGTFIAYSLGDFLGDGEKAGTNYSVLLDLTITKSGLNGQTKITAYDYTPIFLVQEETGTRLVRIKEAMVAHEMGSLGCVNETTYAAMKAALSRIESRLSAK